MAQVAAAGGVTEMTFFRHFGAKHGVLFDDPYDPVIVAAVADQPSTLDPLRRVTRGLRQAWARVPDPDGDVVRRRVRIVAATPSLRGEMWRNNAETERLVADRLIADGIEPLPAKVAAAAVLAGVTAALLEWSLDEDTSLADAIHVALDTVEAAGG